MAETDANVVVIPEKPVFSEDELLDLQYRTGNNLELEGDLKAKVDADTAYHAWLKDNPQGAGGEQGTTSTEEEETTETITTETTEENNDGKPLPMPASLSAMLTEMGITEFNDDAVTKIKSKFKEAEEIPSLRDALTKTRELLSVKPEEKYGTEILELAEFTKKFNLPVKAAASLLSEIKGYDPLKDGSTTALMIQFKMENPDYKGSEEKLKKYIESIYEIDLEDTRDEFLDIKQAKLTSYGNKAIARINEVKSVLSNRPAAADYEAILSTQKSTWSPIVKSIIGAKEGIPSINFEVDGEKYSISVPKDAVAAMENEILDAVRGMDVKEQKSIDQAYKIIQGKYLINNVAKIIHEGQKELKAAHAKEVVALNKAKDEAVTAKQKEVEKKYVNYKSIDASGRIVSPVVAGILSNDQIAVNRKLESQGKKPYYISGKEPWKNF